MAFLQAMFQTAVHVCQAGSSSQQRSSSSATGSTTAQVPAAFTDDCKVAAFTHVAPW